MTKYYILTVVIGTMLVSSISFSATVNCSTCKSCTDAIAAGNDIAVTQDIYDASTVGGGAACITINRSNVTISCVKGRYSRYRIVANTKYYTYNRSGIKAEPRAGFVLTNININSCQVENYGTRNNPLTPVKTSAGIYLTGVTESYVSNNVVNNCRNGILVTGGSSYNVEVKSNAVNDAYFVGIAAWESAVETQILSNDVYDSYLYGISTCHGASDSFVWNNDIVGSGTWGFCFCTDGEDNELKSNRISGSGDVDVHNEEGTNNIGDFNTCGEDMTDAWDDATHAPGVTDGCHNWW